MNKPTFDNSIAYLGGAIFLDHEDSTSLDTNYIILKDLIISNVKSINSGGFLFYYGEQTSLDLTVTGNHFSSINSMQPTSNTSSYST